MAKKDKDDEELSLLEFLRKPPSYAYQATPRRRGVGSGSRGGGGGGGGVGPTKNYRFGVNTSGPEMSPWNGQQFPTPANWLYLADRGVTFIRMPIAWESVQKTLSGALDTTYLDLIKAAIDGAWAYGISTIIDLHNTGAYANQAQWTTTVGYAGNAGQPGTGVNLFGGGVLTTATFADVWSKLATALTGRPGIAGFGIMNEPGLSNVAFGVNKFGNPNGFSIGVGSTPWFAVGTGSVLTKQAFGSNPLGASYSPAWQITGGSGYGGIGQGVPMVAGTYTLSWYAKSTGANQSHFGGAGDLFGAKIATSSWQRFSVTGAQAAPATPVCQIAVDTATTNIPILIANAQLELAGAASAYQPNAYIPYAQAAITAIRAVNTDTPIYLSGLGGGNAYYWQQQNWELATLTGGNLVFEAHQYFDGPQGIGGGGAYSGTFTSYGCNTNTGAEAVAPFAEWAKLLGVTGFLGEFGVVNNNTDNNAQWLPTQVNFVTALKNNNIKGTQWFFGSGNLQPANNLNIATLVNDPRLMQMLAVR